MFDFYLFGLIFSSPWETIEVVAVAVFFANVITVTLPNKSDNKYLQFCIDALNTLSMNIMRNANRLYPKRFPLPKKKTKRKTKRAVDKRLGGSDA